MISWLGLDPSLTHFGWSAFRDPDTSTQCALVDAGLWVTERDEKFRVKKGQKKPTGITADTNNRVRHLGELLDDLVRKHKPVIIFTEGLALPWEKTSAITLSTLGRMRGIIDGLSIAHHVPVVDYSAQRVKAHFTGSTKNEEGGGKAEVARRVLQLYPSLRILLPEGKAHENVTDAAAVGHMGSSSMEIEWHRSQLGRNVGQLELGASEVQAERATFFAGVREQLGKAPAR